MFAIMKDTLHNHALASRINQQTMPAGFFQIQLAVLKQEKFDISATMSHLIRILACEYLKYFQLETGEQRAQ